MSREQVAVAYRWAAELGFAVGGVGHVVERDADRRDHFWTAAWGVTAADMTAGDVVLVGPDGKPVDDSRSVNPTAQQVHGPLHASRPDIGASVHFHAPASVAWAALARPLVAISQEACGFHQRHAIHSGPDLARSLGSHRALLMPHHGAVTVGRSVGAAMEAFVSLEAACATHLAAFAAGDPVPMEDAEAATIAMAAADPDVAEEIFAAVERSVRRRFPEVSSQKAGLA